VRDAVLEAAGRQFAARGTNASLRDIADEAGVNLGLIHRHFGNKDDLLRAVLARATQGGVRVVEEAPDIAHAVREMFLQSSVNDRYVRTVAWLLLAGVSVAEIQSAYPSIGALRARASGEVADLDLLACFALIYGWTVFGAQLLAAFERRPDERAAVEQHLAGALERFLSGPRPEPAA
jgi:AcrR family transcriptional regulator